MSARCGGKQIQYRIRRSTSVETGVRRVRNLCRNSLMYSLSGVHGGDAYQRAAEPPHTSVWKSPSDESGVLAEEESQFLLCSSIRSFCSPGTMDSSGVMFLKLSQELWSSGFDLSLMEEGKENGRIRRSTLLMGSVTQNSHKGGGAFPVML